MKSTETKWIGPDDRLKVGTIGFLVSHTNTMRGSDVHELRDTPAYTNMSHRPRLDGWCGETNNVSTYGCGMAIVERVAKNGRALVRGLEGDDLRAALEEFGYPELMPED